MNRKRLAACAIAGAAATLLVLAAPATALVAVEASPSQPAMAHAEITDPAHFANIPVADPEGEAAVRFAAATAELGVPTNAALLVGGGMLTVALALWRRRRPRWSAATPGAVLLPRAARHITPIGKRPRNF